MKKLLIIVGAGASLEFGMPSVKEVDTLFEKWAREILPLNGNSSESLYSWVKQKLQDYAAKNPHNRTDYIVNFENILFVIQNLYSLSSDREYSNYNNKLNPFIEISDFPEVTVSKMAKKVDSFDLHLLHSSLVDRLVKFMREECLKNCKSKSKEFTSLSLFFKELETIFELGFINLNYDNVILSTLPHLNTGFEKSTGKFRRRLIYDAKWDFCYHLHGSVHFDMKGGDDNTEMHKISWNSNLDSVFSQNSSGRNSINTSEGLSHLNSNIITGLDKANQLLREPFSSYYFQLESLVYQADSILFLGYGFNDLHLNSIFPFIRYDSEKIRKVVIVDCASNAEDSLRFRHDGWSYGVFTTLPSDGSDMGDGKNRAPKPIVHFKKNNTLEKSRNPRFPLAIWYNGMLEACNNPKKILAELV